MKKLMILFIVAISVISCNRVKDYKCEVEVVTDPSYLDGEGITVYFTGTKDEMKQYESINSGDILIGDVTYYRDVNCK